MRQLNSRLQYVYFLLMLTILLVSVFLQPVQAQTPNKTPTPGSPTTASLGTGSINIWSTPSNLSRSGAASQPHIFAAQDGRLQVFWLDRFDGLMTALNNKDTWSLPVQTTRPTSLFIVKPLEINLVPFLFSDAQDRIHAFWYGEKEPLTGEAPLRYNTIPIGSSSWSAPVPVTDSAPIFDALPTGDGGVQLTIIRTLANEPAFPISTEIPPGLYSSRSLADARTWGAFSAVDNSTYYRNINPETSLIRMAVKGSAVFLAWLDPRLRQVLYSASTDGGITWSEPTSFGPPGAQIKEPQLAILPSGEVVRIWQDDTQSGCVLYQQTSKINVVQAIISTQTPLSPYRPTPTPAVNLGEWSEPKQVLSGLTTCPGASRFIEQNGTLYWLWGENTPTIYLSAWDDDREGWAQPYSMSFSFEDAETGLPVQLDNLQAALSEDQIAIVGADLTSSEVWSSSSQLSKIELTFAAPSPWSVPLTISAADQTASQMTVAVDSQANTHIIWSQGKGNPGTSLYYTIQTQRANSQAIEIVRSAKGEIVRQPSLFVDSQDRLHLVWSGGQDGEIYFSRALADQAGSASGWLPAIQVSEKGNASWPQIAGSLGGRLFILYAVPLNERRGVYLVYSDNGGDTWSTPSLLFDARANEWEKVDHPSLAVAPDGSLHAAWSRLKIAAVDPTEGIFYTRTRAAFQGGGGSDQPTTTGQPENLTPDPQWLDPVEVAPNGSDWVRLASISDQIHLLYWSEGVPNHRWVSLNEQTAEGLGWETASRLPSWESSETNTGSYDKDSPYSMAHDYSSIRVVSPLPDTTSLRLSEWIYSPSGSRWSMPEYFTPPGLWHNISPSAAMSPLSGGKLAIAWLSLLDSTTSSTPIPTLPQVLFAVREIDLVEVPSAPIITAVSLPTSIPQGTPTEIPTVTPQLNIQPEGRANSVSPLVLGSGLAAVIVIAIFIGILIQSQKR